MTEIDIVAVYTKIGEVLGTPVAIAAFWAFSKIRELRKELDELKKKYSELSDKHYSILDIVSKMREDIAFIRGQFEKKDR